MKEFRLALAILLILMLWATPTVVFAEPVDALRCDGGVITDGASRTRTIEKCGFPATAKMRQERRQGGVIMVERWAYDFGPEDYYILTFEGLGLKRIDR